MSEQTTFRNLQKLEEARILMRNLLKGKYFEVVQPFKKIILQVGEANGINHFEAAAKINLDGALVPTLDKKALLASALMEIVEEINFQGFKNDEASDLRME